MEEELILLRISFSYMVRQGRPGMDKNKCYRISPAEKIVKPEGSHVVAPGKVPAGILTAGSWMVEVLYKPTRVESVLARRSLVEGGRGKVNISLKRR